MNKDDERYEAFCRDVHQLAQELLGLAEAPPLDEWPFLALPEETALVRKFVRDKRKSLSNLVACILRYPGGSRLVGQEVAWSDSDEERRFAWLEGETRSWLWWLNDNTVSASTRTRRKRQFIKELNLMNSPVFSDRMCGFVRGMVESGATDGADVLRGLTIITFLELPGSRVLDDSMRALLKAQLKDYLVTDMAYAVVEFPPAPLGLLNPGGASSLRDLGRDVREDTDTFSTGWTHWHEAAEDECNYREGLSCDLRRLRKVIEAEGLVLPEVIDGPPRMMMTAGKTSSEQAEAPLDSADNEE